MQGLPPGTVLINAASIRFDDCDYIQTGTVSNTIADESVKSFSLGLYPNPVESEVKIKAFSEGFNVEMQSVQVCDLKGKGLRLTPLDGQSEAELYLQDLDPGSYLLIVQDKTGRRSATILI